LYIELKTVKRFFYTILITVLIGVSFGLFLLYGPIENFRTFLVTSAMTTLNHKWLATTFYDNDIIYKILDNNSTTQPNSKTNDDEIDFDKINNITDELVKRDGNEPIKVVKIVRNGFVGFMTIVYNPTKVKLGVTNNLFKGGEQPVTVAKKNNALALINASGFIDIDGHGDGGTPTGIVIHNSEVIYDVKMPQTIHNIIGFNDKHKLILGKYTNDQAKENNIVDGVEFGPFLIVNGVPCTIKGNGGWGLAPRTAIGQRNDGIVLFLTIDGRQPGYSIGASMKDVLNLMIEYGAHNAANLDGGSSSILVYKGTRLNTPSSKGGDRSIPNWFMVTQ